MTPRGAMVRWSLIGAATAMILLIAQASAVGGWEGLLQVGEVSALRPIIEAELGEIPVSPGPGHDGQIYYAIGLDLDGDVVPERLNHGGYRYRRILYPLVSSIGGLLDGRPLLYGMIGVTVVSAAVAAGFVAAISVRGGKSDWLALVVLLNPGVWLSIRLLTADTLALALMVVALFFTIGRRSSAITGFALSALAKDVYLLTPAGLALSKDKRRWLLVLFPALLLLLWSAWLGSTMGDALTPRGNLALPFVGIIEGSSNWSSFALEEWFYLLFALGSVALGLVISLIRRSWVWWSLAAWCLLGIVSSNWVWDFGNNAARAFAPVAVLVALSYLPIERLEDAKASLTSADAG